jgi:hypothetical protein
MAGKYISASIKPSRRVQIVRTDDKGPGARWKPGQFGYAISYSTRPGMLTENGPSAPDELSYLVAKSKDGHTGASWFSAEALRFTGQDSAPRPSHATKVGTERPFYELKKTDVGKVLISAFGRKWLVSDFIGRVLPTDVGKRVYKAAADMLQVENNAQRARRLGR